MRIVNRQYRLFLRIGDGEIGGGIMAVQADTALYVYAGLAGLLQQRFAVKITADGGNQMHIAAQQRQVMRDISRHAARGALDITRV